MSSSAKNKILSDVQSKLVYSRVASVAELQQDVALLRQFDAEQEQLQSKGKKTGCLGMLLAFAGGGVIFLSLATAMLIGAGLGALMMVAGFVIAIYGLVSNQKHARLNLDNTRYETLGGILRLVGADVDKDEPISAHVDFGNHNSKRNHLRDGRAGHWKVKYYVNAWFKLQGRLLDGAKFDLAMTQKHQDRSRTKRSASGKTKYKSKTKSAAEASLRLRVKEKRYPRLAELSQGVAEAIRLPPGAELKAVTVEGLSLNVTVRFASSGRPADAQKQAQRHVEILAAMMLSLYQVLNRSRASA